MGKGILARKVGMTQIFTERGTVVPVTVLESDSCHVVQRKTTATDGYESVQIGLVDATPAKVRKPLAGHYKKANVPPTRVRREVALAPPDKDGPDKDGKQDDCRDHDAGHAQQLVASGPDDLLQFFPDATQVADRPPPPRGGGWEGRARRPGAARGASSLGH